MVADGAAIYVKVILSLTRPSKAPFWTSKLIFEFFDFLKFYFSSITPFFGHQFPIPSHKKGSYGPYGPF